MSVTCVVFYLPSQPIPTGEHTKDVTITREGNGKHKAGHAWELRVNGKYCGMYETKRQAQDAADDMKEN